MSKPMNTGYVIKLLLDWAAQSGPHEGVTTATLIFKAMELSNTMGDQWIEHWHEQLTKVKWRDAKPICETFFTLSSDCRWVRNFVKFN